MLTVCAAVLSVVSALLAFLLWQKQQEINRLRVQNEHLNSELTLVLEKLAASESSDLSADGLLDKVVRGLVALGVPGLVLLVATAVSGYAGAAAITTALAAMGGPGGMIGGIGVLILVGLVSRALTKWGLPKIAKPVIRGLIAAGSTPAEIRIKVSSYPKWVISGEIRAKIYETLASFQEN
jgi:hypothetical protein